MSGQFGLLEKSASWAEVGGVGASWLLSDESAKVKTMRTLQEGWGPQVRGSFGGRVPPFSFFWKAPVYCPPPPPTLRPGSTCGKVNAGVTSCPTLPREGLMGWPTTSPPPNHMPGDPLAWFGGRTGQAGGAGDLGMGVVAEPVS